MSEGVKRREQVEQQPEAPQPEEPAPTEHFEDELAVEERLQAAANLFDKLATYIDEHPAELKALVRAYGKFVSDLSDIVFDVGL